MNDANRIRLTKAAAERLALLAKALDVVGSDGTTVVGRIRDAQGGLRARCYEAASRTVRHDSAFAGIAGDDAVRDERDLDARITEAVRAVNAAWLVVARYPPVHSATDADRNALRRDNARPEPCCANCATVPADDGRPRHEPPHPRQAEPSDCAGRLPAPMWLCSWCYERVRAWGRLPSTSELVKHHRGERVAWPADVKAKPA